MISRLDPEDEKLVVLARGARSRINASEGAAVRDESGRSYSGASVALGDFKVSALQLAVLQAAASGARGLEAAVVVSDNLTRTTIIGLVEVAELGDASVPVFICGPDGAVVSRTVADINK